MCFINLYGVSSDGSITPRNTSFEIDAVTIKISMTESLNISHHSVRFMPWFLMLYSNSNTVTNSKTVWGNEHVKSGHLMVYELNVNGKHFFIYLIFMLL